MKKAYILLILLCLPMVLAYDSTTIWTEGVSNFNISFSGINNYTGNLSIPSGAWAINISFNMTGYANDSQRSNVSDDAVSEYWQEDSGTVTNPNNFDDGDNDTFSTFVGGTPDIYWYGNFTSDSTVTYGLLEVNQKLESGSGGAYYYYCQHEGNLSWTRFFDQNPIPSDAWYNDSKELPSDCLGYDTVYVRILWNQRGVVNPNQLYEPRVIVNKDIIGIIYPENVTVLYNGQEKYTNGSIFNERHDLNVSISEAYSDNLFDVVFKSNKTGYLYVADLFAEWNSPNLSIEIRSELVDDTYESSEVKVLRIFDNATYDTYHTSTGIISVQLLNQSGILDLLYYDTLEMFPARHFYYWNDPAISKNLTSLEGS